MDVIEKDVGARRLVHQCLDLTPGVRQRCLCFAGNIEQGATHASGLPLSLTTAAAAQERMRFGDEPPTSRSRGVMHKKQGGSPGRFNGGESKKHNHIFLLLGGSITPGKPHGVRQNWVSIDRNETARTGEAGHPKRQPTGSQCMRLAVVQPFMFALKAQVAM